MNYKDILHAIKETKQDKRIKKLEKRKEREKSESFFEKTWEKEIKKLKEWLLE